MIEQIPVLLKNNKEYVYYNFGTSRFNQIR